MRIAISMKLRLVGFLAASLAAAGCGNYRPSTFEPQCPNYEEKIRPVVEKQCGTCHNRTDAAGGYVVGDHVSTVSRTEDGAPRVDPGNVDSAFLVAARGERAGHRAIPVEAYAALKSWVVTCRAAPKAYENHPKGWVTPTDSEQFHGMALRDAGYSTKECTECHGDDLRGGKSGYDCHVCHTAAEGPKACNTCHGDKDSAAPPRALSGSRSTKTMGVGAHRKHVMASATHPAYDCTTCHLDVKKPEDEGHYRLDGGFVFGAARVKVTRSATDAGVAYDPAMGTCGNTACHSPNPADTAAKTHTPKWNVVGQGALACDACHGQPPSNHFDNRCAMCHGAAYTDGGVETALHLNGKVDLVAADGKCDTCHQGPGGGAFYDTSKRTAANVQTVGAHDAHIRASRLRGPLACDECHLVPATFRAAGHIDSASPAEVFPPAIASKSLAFVDGAAGTYNGANATCSVYCHGASNGFALDTTSTLNRSPKWTNGATEAVCGTACHALPPVDGSLGHQPGVALTTPCSSCHGLSIFPDGGIIVTPLPDGGFTSHHINDRVSGSN